MADRTDETAVIDRTDCFMRSLYDAVVVLESWFPFGTHRSLSELDIICREYGIHPAITACALIQMDVRVTRDRDRMIVLIRGDGETRALTPDTAPQTDSVIRLMATVSALAACAVAIALATLIA